jgi:proline dehydrogenase
MALNGSINVRVCKGIYIESRDIAYKEDSVVNSNFSWLVEELLTKKHYVGIATHDPRLVWSAYKMIDQFQVEKNMFEFQMLLGVDEQMRSTIRKDGYKLRVYVPYGKRWYDYSMRRLKENPKIATYILRSLLHRN